MFLLVNENELERYPGTTKADYMRFDVKIFILLQTQFLKCEREIKLPN